LRVPVIIGVHLLVSAAVVGVLALQFWHNPRVVASHVLLLALWDFTLFASVSALAAYSPRPSVWPARTFRCVLALTCALQVYLYALNVVSHLSWGRNMTAHLVAAFAPTVWSGAEPFPVSPAGITAFTGAILLAAAILGLRGHSTWNPARVPGLAAAAMAAVLTIVFGVTLASGVALRDDLFWKQELITSFFRVEGFAMEPTARRHAVAERDAALRAAYPRHVAGARRKNVVLIMVDSLRADRMQVYGYPRATTPFLSQLVDSGRMRKVDAAFSSCSESFCGITSTLGSREFRDISARTFQLQDVLHDQGYERWFILSGNHRAWNGLPSFYHVPDDRLFDGSQTVRYTMDDDRLVLEGLERVPPAAADQPAFFYLHLMSPHFLGVQFPESHVFTDPGDRLSPGLEPYKIRDQLNKPDRYDDKVLQADGIIRQIFETLRAKHYLDDAIVVVTGDHGEGLGERHWSHGWHLYNEDIRIPLLVYDELDVRYPDLAFATQVDIAPTILDRLGLPVPASWEGQSLLSTTPQRLTRHQTYFPPNRYAVVARDGDALFKFIATPQYGIEELYDLTQDAGERHNLVTEQPERAAELREEVSAYQRD
jgi:glucan phosphoethanolaminetransferase (alkaline phosphatase superfamily)